VSAEPQSPPPGDARARLLFAGGTLAVLAIVVAAVLVLSSGGGDDHEFTAAPQDCVDAWNEDVSAQSLGRHQFDFHHYSEVQVLTLDGKTKDEAPEGSPGALCAVAFASSSLDAELAAAALIRRSGTWYALSDLETDPNRLAELQSNAKSAYNAELTEDGKIEPL
jgi:hypothetical protein